MNRFEEPAVLFDGDDIQVRHYRAPNSEMRLLTFDIMHAKASGRGAFGLSLTRKNAIDHIAVIPKYPCWYPARETERAARIIADLHDRPTIAYGASMGGYGALRWGRAASADCAVACSPQFTIDPEVLGNRDRRYSSHFSPEKHKEMSIRAEHLPGYSAAIYDRYFKQDLAHIEMMADLPDFDAISAPFMAHATAQCLTGSANALAIFRAALAGDGAAIRSSIAKRRRSSEIRRVYLAYECAARGRKREARAILETVRNSMPIEYFMAIAKMQVAEGRMKDAADSYREVLRIRPQHPTATKHLAKIGL